jgi:hypothetical protein
VKRVAGRCMSSGQEYEKGGYGEYEMCSGQVDK